MMNINLLHHFFFSPGIQFHILRHTDTPIEDPPPDFPGFRSENQDDSNFLGSGIPPKKLNELVVPVVPSPLKNIISQNGFIFPNFRGENSKNM